MEQLKKIYEQLRDLFLSMTPGNRVVAGLLVAVLLLSLGYLIVGSIAPAETSSKYVYVFDGWEFVGNDKIAVEAALSGAGLKGYEWIGNRLRVPQKNAANYTAEIAKADAIHMPGNAQSEAARSIGPWDAKNATSQKLFLAKARDAADAIRKLQNIISAEVLPNKRIEWDKNVWARKEIVSVAVHVETLTNKPLEGDTVGAISGLVARAFGITDMKEISIIDGKHSRTYNGNGEEENGGVAGSYLKMKKLHEEEWKDKIYRILPNINGLQVETAVKLKDYFNENIFEVEHTKPKAPLHEHTRGTDYLNEGFSRYGRPGSIAQFSRTMIDPTYGTAEKAKITDKTHEREITNPLSGRESRYQIYPLIPQRVSASLRIPREHVLTTWKERNSRLGETPPDPTTEELGVEEERIREDIRQAVGSLMRDYRDPKSPDPYEMVEVTFYDPPRREEVVLSNWEQIKLWLGMNWQSLSLMGLVLCGLCVLWSITKPAKPDPIVIYEAPEIPMDVFEAQAQAKAEAEAAEAAEEDDDEPERTLEGFDKSIRSLQEEIAELVEENPDAAASVLRQWIGNIVPVENK